MNGREYIKYKPLLTTLEQQYAIDCIQNGTCMRCLSTTCRKEPCQWCRQLCLTCQICRNMGRCASCCCLVNIPIDISKETYVNNNEEVAKCCWDGHLSPQQSEGANAIIQAIQAYRDLFVCAVTGAGKTEMLFPAIAMALKQGERICLAAPRIDVILELEPRLRKAFPNANLVVLHSRQTKAYEYSNFVLCTTHQLLKFKKTFSILIVDETDSYPLRNNDILLNRLPKVATDKHSIIYLTATPTKSLLQLVQQRQINYFELPARYHGYELPVPRYYWIGNWEYYIRQQKLPKLLKKLFRYYIQQKRRFLVFLPHIERMHQLEQLLRQWLNDSVPFASVHAEDTLRLEKILNMRQEQYQFLLTTTILERGVTFSNIDVLVIGSEHMMYTEETLIQIAGRVGRNKDYPIGDVIFAHFGKTDASQRAIAFIKLQNKKANELGYLK